MLHLFSSNRLERLSEQWAHYISEQPLPVFEAECIIVQSKGMQRWLSLELARQQGICAHLDWHFPNTFLESLFEQTLSTPLALDEFNSKTLVWHVLHELPPLLEEPSFESIKHYWEEEPQPLKHYQLCSRIARLYEQYLIYRPKMIHDWEQGFLDHWEAQFGSNATWQSVLWNRILRRTKAPHRATLQQAYYESLQNPLWSTSVLPKRISIFGISSMSPFYIDCFRALSEQIPVAFFHLNPSPEYWGDLLSEKQISKMMQQHDLAISEDDLYLEAGNPLLASLGKVGRDFLGQVLEHFEYEEINCFEPPPFRTLLHAIQHDIYMLQHRAAPGQAETEAAIEITDVDQSIQFHSCHSPLREIEVLHDTLLGLMDHNPDLQPQDILVMSPNIEPYAPFIHAVFSNPDHEGQAIPYSIADRSLRKESQLIDVFFKLLQTSSSRLDVSEILDFLQIPNLQRRFSLLPEDLEWVEHWMQQSNIRWGKDAAHRQQFGLPATGEHTWESGLDRLLLGYTMPTQESQLFQDILPFDDIEGLNAQILGHFQYFLQKLFGLSEQLKTARTLEQWAQLFSKVLDDFFEDTYESGPPLRVLQHLFQALKEQQQKTHFEQPVELDIVKTYLKEILEQQNQGFGFLSRGMTFCSMLPMRSIPFRVICLLGMNDGAFPRLDKPPHFDLMHQSPKRGDRSRKLDDRYLFLETLLSAQDVLYISYLGQNAKNNTAQNPSVLVRELQDTIQQSFILTPSQDKPGAQDVLERLSHQHRIQAFHPEYFEEHSKHPSYSKSNYETALTLQNVKAPLKPFFKEPLKEPDAAYQALSIEELVRFWQHPTRYLLSKRLGLRLESPNLGTEALEPFVLEGLDAFKLSEKLLEHNLNGKNLDEFYDIAKAAGWIPHQNAGKIAYTKAANSVKQMTQHIQAHSSDQPPEPLSIDLQIKNFRLTGSLISRSDKGMLYYRHARIKAKDRIKFFILHQVLNASPTTEHSQHSTLLGFDSNKGPETQELPPTPDAAETLAWLLEHYWKGLQEPLPFFPETSWEYAQALSNQKSDSEALSKALQQWKGSDFIRGEASDPYYQLLYPENPPLNSVFQKLSRNFWKSILTQNSQAN